MVEKFIRTGVNVIKEDYGLFFKLSMAAAHMDPNYKKCSILAVEVEPVTVTDPNFWKWADQILDATLVTRPKKSVVTRRSGTSHIDQPFWENLTKVMGSSMGAMIQSQQIQQQPTATPIVKSGLSKFYRDWALSALMEYAQVYTEAGIPKLWGKFQMSKECA